ncbi:anthranilate synthase component I family protein [bacterium SCSIO 12643]|nr:anthranilate synthase component I family protein [bacterium SCSIO 12643]
MERISKEYVFKPSLKERLIQWASTHKPCAILDSHSTHNQDYPNGISYDLIIGVGAFDQLLSNENSFDKLKFFHEKHQDWLFGYLSYDLKNELENLSSKNEDHHRVPHLHFFVPEIVITIQGELLTISSLKENHEEILNQILETPINQQKDRAPIEIQSRIHHAEYIRGVKSLLHHIQIGDIYEANFCQEFYAENIQTNPFELYSALVQTSPTPFSTFYSFNHNYLMCASPERFIKKTGNQIISQPIKGTAKRSSDPVLDEHLKHQLYRSKKDRTENVMIVDLVRNDLSRTAKQQSVKVDELFGVYSFSNVHQMISTISSEMNSEYHFTDVIKNAFPMGSMTGAPKIMALDLIEKFEHTQRGIYSGSVGYITPEGDFDFNVVIRSLQYNELNNYLSYMVGGAITHNSIPEDEYQECEIKADAIKKVLAGN